MRGRATAALSLTALVAALVVLLQREWGDPPGRMSDVQIVRVTDGDSLTVRWRGKQEKLRLYGIDAPEQEQPGGVAARRFLRELVAAGELRIDAKGRDRYGRMVADLFVAGRSVSEAMVASGWAWHYARYADSAVLARLAREARTARRGLWQDEKPEPPWEWRKRQRQRNRRGR